eukprot:2738496-Amphidinium_carterae.2
MEIWCHPKLANSLGIKSKIAPSCYFSLKVTRFTNRSDEKRFLQVDLLASLSAQGQLSLLADGSCSELQYLPSSSFGINPSMLGSKPFNASTR